MKTIIAILKNRQLLVLIGFVFLILLIFIGGAYFSIPLNFQLIGVAVMLFAFFLFIQIKQLKASSSAALLEKSINAQADNQKLSVRPEKQEEIESLRKDLSSAINYLKSSKLGKKKGVRNALYALPWYLFIGPPAAGKTTAIINSGLEFPSGSDIKGVGGTRNCDWFFSNSAILLDTAGRYTTEDEDREEWYAFLDMLKKFRSRQPINGVIIGISISDILDADNEEIESHAKKIRSRIDELITRLSIQFPIYLAFTKCDLIQGFVESFENLNRKEREQILGATISKEQQKKMKPQEVFSREFEILCSAINDFRMNQFSKDIKPENRKNVYIFPIEFESIKEKAGYFIEKLFQPNPFEENPLFRGFYFTSGTQEGVPIDRVIHNIAQQFELSTDLVLKPDVEKKSYFITHLFTHVIIPDKNLVTRTTKAAIRGNLLRIGTLAASVIMLGLFILGLSQAFIRSKVNLGNMKNTVEKVDKIKWKRSASLVSNFEEMENLRKKLELLESKKRHAALLSLGLYRGNSLLPYLRELYYKKLSFFIESTVYQSVTSNLKRYINGVSFPPGDIYDYLKAYLLMGSEVSRLEESENYGFLLHRLTTILDDVFFRILPENRYEELKPLMKYQIEFYVDNLGSETMPAFENNDKLITQVRNYILHYEQPGIREIYSRIKSKAEQEDLIGFTISDAVGREHRDILVSNDSVPGFFTKNGMLEYVEEAIEEESIAFQKEMWVFGQKEGSFAQDLRDPDLLKKKLMAIYLEEYSREWKEFVKSIGYKPYHNIGDASESMKILGDPMISPFIPLINKVTEQTRLIKPVEEKEVEEEKGFIKKNIEKAKSMVKKKIIIGPKHKEAKYRVNEQFRSIHSYGSSIEGKISENLKEILNQYMEIGTILESMLSDPGLKARDYAAGFLTQGTGDLYKVLNQIRRTASMGRAGEILRNTFFEEPVISSWATICNETQRYLNTVWKTQIYDEFRRTMGDYYPFDPEGRDASIADVKRFFQPSDGILWAYVENELIPFLKRNSWSTNTWEGYGVKISSKAVQALEVSKRIKKVLFTNGFPVKFSLKPLLPVNLSGKVPSIEQVFMKIDGVENYYQMGMQRYEEFQWPGMSGSNGAQLKIIMRDKRSQPKPENFGGEWGWLKLLERAKIVPERGTRKDFNLYWFFGDKEDFVVRINYKLRAQSEDNPFIHLTKLFDVSFPSRLN